VKKRFIDPVTCHSGALFVPARVADNSSVDQDSYVESLSYLDPLTRAQLLRGDWDAVAGGRFKKEWFGGYRRDQTDFVVLTQKGEEAERFNWHNRPKFQTCDPAASTSSAADYFVLSTWLLSPKANLLWGCERDKLEIQDQVTTCQTSYRRHRPSFVAVEEVMNQRSLAQILRRSTNPAMVVHGVTPGGRKKLDHAIAAIALAASGRIYLPEDNPMFPLDDVVSEVTRFTGDDKKDANDDIVDTLSYAAEALPMLNANTSGKPIGFWKPTTF
jgi:phage terminase large subunit-like protein